jgi:nucleoside-diphosphate-sugar epimerase
VRVLLAGATGAIGRPLVPRLVAAGHDVVALTRRADRLGELRAAGAEAHVCDVRDRDALLRIARAASPDVVLDETTDLPQRYDPRRMDLFYQGMGPLRLIGTPNLMDAALIEDARFVFQSVAFLHQPGPGLRTEDDPPFLDDPPPPWDAALPVICALEQRTVARGGTVLRYGMFRGPHTHFAPGGQVHDDVQARRMPLVGRGTGVFSFVHVDDAAEATVLALGWDGEGILQIVDDEPIAVRDWLPAFARELGARAPLRVPAWVARRVAGPLAAHWSTTMPGASNARAKAELGWSPAHASVRDGFGASPARPAASPPRTPSHGDRKAV